MRAAASKFNQSATIQTSAFPQRLSHPLKTMQLERKISRTVPQTRSIFSRSAAISEIRTLRFPEDEARVGHYCTREEKAARVAASKAFELLKSVASDAKVVNEGPNTKRREGIPETRSSSKASPRRKLASMLFFHSHERKDNGSSDSLRSETCDYSYSDEEHCIYSA